MDKFKIKIDGFDFSIVFATNAYDLVKNEYDKLEIYEHSYRLLEAKINVMDDLIEFAELNLINKSTIENLFEQIIEIEL
jgi:hypothetical protein